MVQRYWSSKTGAMYESDGGDYVTYCDHAALCKAVMAFDSREREYYDAIHKVIIECKTEKDRTGRMEDLWSEVKKARDHMLKLAKDGHDDPH